MATANFAHPKNASKYFVVGTNREEEISKCECGEFWEWEDGYIEKNNSSCTACGENVEHGIGYRPIEDWEWEHLKSLIIESLQVLPDFIVGESFDNDRNYNSTFLGNLYKSKAWGDVEFEVKIIPAITSAYYEGATLDFKIEITTNGGQHEWDYNESNMNEILDGGFDEWHTDLNRGLATRFRPFAEKWIEETITEPSEKVEKVFEQLSEHKLNRKGSFSNGEAFYEEV